MHIELGILKKWYILVGMVAYVFRLKALGGRGKLITSSPAGLHRKTLFQQQQKKQNKVTKVPPQENKQKKKRHVYFVTYPNQNIYFCIMRKLTPAVLGTTPPSILLT